MADIRLCLQFDLSSHRSHHPRRLAWVGKCPHWAYSNEAWGKSVGATFQPSSGSTAGSCLSPSCWQSSRTRCPYHTSADLILLRSHKPYHRGALCNAAVLGCSTSPQSMSVSASCHPGTLRIANSSPVLSASHSLRRRTVI